MLGIYEDLARARMASRHEEAEAAGLAHRLVALRRQRRRSAEASRRARAARDTTG